MAKLLTETLRPLRSTARIGGSERTKVTYVILSSRNALNIYGDADHSH